MPEYTAEATGLGTLRLLEAVRQVAPESRFFFAATSEIFGEPLEVPQSEKTPMAPINPYAAAKVYALNLVRIYRGAYGLHASAGILFNHESPRRGENYVTRKIARCGRPDRPGPRPRASPRDARPEARLELCGRHGGRHPEDRGGGPRRRLRPRLGRDALGAATSARRPSPASGSTTGSTSSSTPSFVRPLDISETRGDASKARRELGWAPKTSFPELVKLMVDAELAAIDGGGESS